jgi:hypothetical protein
MKRRTDIWSIGEVKFCLRRSEAHPAIQYATATPFAWDAAFATDGNPLTRWKNREAIRPGMQWRVKFRAPVTLDGAELHCAHDQWEQPALWDLRALAATALKGRGIDYPLAGGNSRLACQFRSDPGGWKLASPKRIAQLCIESIRRLRHERILPGSGWRTVEHDGRNWRRDRADTGVGYRWAMQSRIGGGGGREVPACDWRVPLASAFDGGIAA